MCIEALHEKLNPEVVDILNEKDPWFAGLRGARDSFKGRERA